MTTQTLIDAIQTGDNSLAQDMFIDAMHEKIRDSLDAKRAEVGTRLYGNEDED